MPPLALADVFFRRDPGGLPFQSLDPEASAGSVLVIHDHNRLAIRPNVSAPGFAPVPAECVAAGIAAARKQTVPACVRARARNLTTPRAKLVPRAQNHARFAQHRACTLRGPPPTVFRALAIGHFGKVAV